MNKKDEETLRRIVGQSKFGNESNGGDQQETERSVEQTSEERAGGEDVGQSTAGPPPPQHAFLGWDSDRRVVDQMDETTPRTSSDPIPAQHHPQPSLENIFSSTSSELDTAIHRPEDFEFNQPLGQRGEGPQFMVPSFGDAVGESDNIELLVNKLSDRFGTLQVSPAGQVNYYGPTSNFSLVDIPSPERFTLQRTARTDGQEYLDRLAIGKEIPPDFEDHLSNLYFAWLDPVSHAVNRSMYEAARIRSRHEKKDTPYYSEALRNAMFVFRN
jgi:hypothetical protein